MKQYMAPKATSVAYPQLMEDIIKTSTIRVDPSQALGRRFHDTWDFNADLSAGIEDE
ncbi:MAG: hypothetical protein Q4A44_00340 [Bacteroidales bacterium]|nr:hypothetical protein [Bacteroidales bacterium]